MASPGFTVVIPARFASTRFPGKTLFPIKGKPMILHTAQRARESGASAIVIATDHIDIKAVCEQHGLDVQMTDVAHPSGTDRIAEVADVRNWPDEQLIVGLQCDEPATAAEHLNLLANNLMEHADADMATLCMRITSQQDYHDPNRVKVVRDANDMALYFSRAAIPASRQRLLNSSASSADGSRTSTEASHINTVDGSALEGDPLPPCFLHIGLYAYRRSFLRRYQKLSCSELELVEQLEQLRALYHGGRIHVDEVAHTSASGVDHPDDIARVEAMFSRSGQLTR